jgi:hypothetical protein
MVNKRNHPQMGLNQFSDILQYNLPSHIQLGPISLKPGLRCYPPASDKLHQGQSKTNDGLGMTVAAIDGLLNIPNLG